MECPILSVLLVGNANPLCYWSRDLERGASMDQKTRNNVTWVEFLAYGLLAALIATGYRLAAVDEGYFRNVYVPEDGVLETATAIMLFSCAVIVVLRVLRERQMHPRSFFVIGAVMAVVFFFVAGEEISWGQRIFGVESSEFFLKNNRQDETNLHNLEVRGVNLNKLIFGRMLVLFLIGYYLILPYLFSRRGRVYRWASSLYFPVPKIHNGVMMLALGLFVEQIPSSKRGELNEVCLGVFALLLVTSAQNIRRRNG